MISGSNANAVELCGSAAGTCRYALAQVRGNNLEIAGDGQPVARVRYAWSDYPIVNLYDRDMLRCRCSSLWFSDCGGASSLTFRDI